MDTTIHDICTRIAKRNYPSMSCQFDLCYRDDNNDLTKLESDEDHDCALKRHPSFVQADTFLCVIIVKALKKLNALHVQNTKLFKTLFV
ncbi:hypothetical protein BDC45DRAFT_574777 [Circinella umbellata]|nr:hypothetical protein BDC45DRAFT_574777 [Circinella umbellata]